MKPNRFDLVYLFNLPTSWENWMLVLFLGFAIVAGGVAAVASMQLGWLGLVIVPVLVFAMAMLIWPEVGLLTFVFIIYIQLTYVINNFHSGIPAPGVLLLGALVFLIIWRMAIYGDRPDGWRRASVIIIIIGSWLLSVLVADDFTLAFVKLQKFIENALLAFIVAFFIKDRNSLRRIIWVLVAAGMFMASISVFQNMTGTFSNFYWGYGGWIEASTGGASSHRLAGPYGNPNAYAQVLVMLVPLALDRLWHEKELRFRLIAGYALAVCTLAVFFTYSRNGFVTLVFTVGFLILMRRLSIAPLVVTAVFGVLLIQFLPATYTARITTLFQFSNNSTSLISDESFRGRISENIAAWRMFQDHPLFGVGLDNFQVNYQEYSRQIGLDSRRDQRSPASFYLELLSEQGLIGTMIFIVFMFFIFRSLWRAYRLFYKIGMENEAHMALAFMAGLAGYMVFYISKNSAYPNVFWVLLGTALSIAQVSETSATSLQQQIHDS